MSFGKRLKSLREQKGISMAALGKEINTSSSRISDWENEKTDPSSIFVVKIAKFFGVSTDWLLIGEEDHPNDKITIKETLNPVDENEELFLRSFRDLYKTDQQHLLMILNGVFGIARKRENTISEESSIYNVDSTKKIDDCTKSESNHPHRIPVLGVAAAGVPIEAIRFVEGYLSVHHDYKDCFAVKVKGESMINVGIKDGGYAIVRQQSVVQNNEIALVMVDNQVTIKRFKLQGETVTLISENDDIPPMKFAAHENMRIVGKVIEWLDETAAVSETI